MYLMYEEINNTPELNCSTDQHVSSEKGKAPASVSENKGKSVKGPEPIIIPLILNMAGFDHEAFLEECSSSDNWPVQDRDKLISNVKPIQDYLCSFSSKGLTVLNLSAATFAQTLDWLHGYLLEQIGSMMKILRQKTMQNKTAKRTLRVETAILF